MKPVSLVARFSEEPQLTPTALFEWLAGLPRKHELFVECGAGQGEIAQFMARRFKLAVATDIKPPPAQIGGNNEFCVVAAEAECLPFDNGSTDLLVSMQSLHFFDLERHLAEARRVLRQGGVYAAFAWGEIAVPAGVAEAFAPLMRAIEPFWEPARNRVISGYPDVAFSGTAIPIPQASMSRLFSCAELEGLISTWSAARLARKAGVRIPRPDCRLAAIPLGGRFTVSWPIVGRTYRIDC